MATMTKQQIEQAMADAGLVEPRVIPHMGADRKGSFNLYAGSRGARREANVPKTNNDAAVKQAIGALSGSS